MGKDGRSEQRFCEEILSHSTSQSSLIDKDTVHCQFYNLAVKYTVNADRSDKNIEVFIVLLLFPVLAGFQSTSTGIGFCVCH